MGNMFSSSLQTVGPIDLQKYSGKWYEIARIPTIFEMNDTNVTATYTLEGGVVRLLNESYKNGKYTSISGAVIPYDEYNSKLRVKFDIPFLPEGNYWIILCDSDYNFAVISEPNKEMLWILSRTKVIDENIYQLILNSISKDFDLNKIIKTIQN